MPAASTVVSHVAVSELSTVPHYITAVNNTDTGQGLIIS